MRVYSNPHCSKCRQCLQILKDHGQEFELIDYLQTPPTRQVLEQLWELLGPEMLRNPADNPIEALLANPALMQRPIVTHGPRALVARPPERVRELL